MRKHTQRRHTPCPSHTISHGNWSRFTDSLNRPFPPPRAAPTKSRQTPQSHISGHRPQRVTGGRTGPMEVLQKCRVWGKYRRKKRKQLHLYQKDLLTSVLDSWLWHKAIPAQKTVNTFFIQRMWRRWPIPDQWESRNRGTYRLQTLSGSSPRYRSGSPPRWWWCSQCPSLSSGPGRHDRGCASALPELSFACQTVKIKRSKRHLSTWGWELCLGHDP